LETRIFVPYLTEESNAGAIPSANDGHALWKASTTLDARVCGLMSGCLSQFIGRKGPSSSPVNSTYHKLSKPFFRK